MLLPDKTLIIRRKELFCSSKHLIKGRTKYNLLLFTSKTAKASLYIYKKKVMIAFLNDSETEILVPEAKKTILTINLKNEKVD